MEVCIMNENKTNKTTDRAIVNKALLKRINNGNYTVRRGMPVVGQSVSGK